MNQLNILIIDDNRDLADGLGMILEDEGCRVTLAYNGGHGIEAFDAGHFDVVLIDVKLPDISGVEVFHKIRKQDPNARTIMMTGYRVEEVLKEVIENGDAAILRKPFEFERVSEMLDKDQEENIILIAGEDPGFAERLTAHLTGHGIKTMLSCNGQAAVDGVFSGSAEVLVLDLRMPIIYGLEVYLELKQRGRIVKTIIVAGCTDMESGSVDILRSASVTGCLFKPFKPESMFSAINRVMGRQAGLNC